MKAKIRAIKPLGKPAEASNNNNIRPNNNLNSDLLTHVSNHTREEIFDSNCYECIYWAAKIIQNPDNWQVVYVKQQRKYLKNLPLEKINKAIGIVNQIYTLQQKAHSMTENEWRLL